MRFFGKLRKLFVNTFDKYTHIHICTSTILMYMCATMYSYIFLKNKTNKIN